MEANKGESLAKRIYTLTVLDSLLQDHVVRALLRVLQADDERGRYYCEFVAAVYRAGGDLGEHLLQQVLNSENPVVRMHAAGTAVPRQMADSLKNELVILSEIAALPCEQLAEIAGQEALPAYASTAHDFGSIYSQRLAQAATCGYGIFAKWHMFTIAENAELLPVKNPDPQRISQLEGYEREREQVVLNTRALLAGLAASNILLYGDAGTGKSSTVKAIANEFCKDGLRLVEVRKNQLYQIPLLMDKLAENPLKFILFIDDLSFPADDKDFTALKAILEGNVSARPSNIAVYATSNRRHLMRQSFGSRTGDEVHLSDTLEEEASLSARFGLTVTFQRPSREEYAQVVLSIAKEIGVDTDEKVLCERAEAYAIRCGGRSPRAARQFVEQQKAMQAFNGDGR